MLFRSAPFCALRQRLRAKWRGLRWGAPAPPTLQPRGDVGGVLRPGDAALPVFEGGAVAPGSARRGEALGLRDEQAPVGEVVEPGDRRLGLRHPHVAQRHAAVASPQSECYPSVCRLRSRPGAVPARSALVERSQIVDYPWWIRGLSRVFVHLSASAPDLASGTGGDRFQAFGPTPPRPAGRPAARPRPSRASPACRCG